jgi:branched-chain amino acid transport system substrate-binding protein
VGAATAPTAAATQAAGGAAPARPGAAGAGGGGQATSTATVVGGGTTPSHTPTGPTPTGSVASPAPVTTGGNARPSATASTTQGAHACTGPLSPIVIGSVGTQSGLIGSIIGSGAKAVQAWATAINAQGGVACHPVKYILADDGGDPSRHQALVQQLVEQERVIALVQMDSVLTGQSSVSYLSSHKVPVIGAEGGSSWFYTSPYYFPESAQGTPTDESVTHGAAKVAKQNGMTKLGVIACIEAQICAELGQRAPQVAQADGATVVYKTQASLTQPDFTSICQSAKSAGVQVMEIAMDGNSVQRILQSCNNVAFHPIYVAQSLGLTAALPSNKQADGVYGVVVTYPWMLTNNAANVQFQSVMRQYAPGFPLDSGAAQGWVSAQIFQLAAQNMPATPTSQAVLEGLWKVKNNSFGGLTNPITNTQGQNAAHNYCWWLIQIKSGAYTSPDGGQSSCTTF